MTSEPEYAPGDPAPETGTYELLRVVGAPAGPRVHAVAGTALPDAPRAWTWRLVRGG
jgi:hypothetical protein